MVKSRKKLSISKRRSGKVIKTRKKYNMSGGLTALQTYGNTQYSSKMASTALTEERNLQKEFASPEIIRGYLHDARYGTKYGSASFLKIFNNLLTLRKDNISSIESIIKKLSNYDRNKPELAHASAFPEVQSLHRTVTEERYHVIKTQEDEIKTHFKLTAFMNDRKKDQTFNDLSKAIHELRKIVLEAFYILVKTENDKIYNTIGTVIKQGSNKFSGESRGRSLA